MADSGPNNRNLPHSKRNNRRTLVGALLLAIIGTVFISLGNWQLNRADERRLIAQQIEQGRQSTPVRLGANADASALKAWQAADATGTWLAQWSVLLDNRNLDGKPGYWLATPMLLGPDRAILVVRGWLARPIGQFNPFPAIAQSTDSVAVNGEIAMRVPQLYELADPQRLAFDRNAVTAVDQNQSVLDLDHIPQRQNVSVDELSNATGIQFLPVVLLQTNAADGQDLVRQWPTPSIDADTNIGYAMQWFSFAAIAFGAMGVLLWRIWRHAKITT